MLFAAGLAACDNAVDPLVDGGAHAFAVFGYLHTASDTQFVRVSRLQGESVFSEAGLAHPDVRSTDLETGVTTIWADSVVALADGRPGLIYYSALDVRPGSRYLLEVSDGAEAPTRAITSVPGSVGLFVGAPHPNFVDDLEQTVVWSGLRRGRDAVVHYRILTIPSGVDTTVAITYRDAGEVHPSGWLVDVTLERDARVIRNLVLSARGDTAVAFLDVSMSIEAPSEEWSQSEEALNIENGTGFFASVARLRESWALDSTVVRSIGFELP